MKLTFIAAVFIGLTFVEALPQSISVSGGNSTTPDAPGSTDNTQLVGTGDAPKVNPNELTPLPPPSSSPPAVPKAAPGTEGGPLIQDPNLPVGEEESGTQSVTGKDDESS